MKNIKSPSSKGWLNMMPHQIDRTTLRRPVFKPPTKPLTENCRRCTQSSTEHIIRTVNNKGHSMENQYQVVDLWVESLPESEKPLLDLGAGHGFHTAYAIQKGREVISIDEEKAHLDHIGSRVEGLSNSNSKPPFAVRSDRLADLRQCRLPEKEVVSNCSVARVLATQMIHFLNPGEPLELFNDVYSWLEPGGRFVVTSMSPSGMNTDLKQYGATLTGGHSIQDAWRMIDIAEYEDLARAAPLRFTVMAADNSQPKTIYPLSLQELLALAQLSGFMIEFLDYISLNCYPSPVTTVDDVSLLAARKPKLSQ